MKPKCQFSARSGRAGPLLAARARGLAIERLDLRTSGDTAGGAGRGGDDRVVGYGAWALYE